MDQIQEITVVVPGRPVPMQRPRINIRAVLAQVHRRRAAGPLVFTPAKSKNWQKVVAKVFRMCHPIRGFVIVYVWFVMTKPKSLSAYSLRPDLDNFVKNVFDGLVLGGIIADDSWIDEYHVFRVWTNDEREQETVIHIKQR